MYITQLLCWPYPFSGFYKLEIFVSRVFGKNECWNVEGVIDCIRKRCISPQQGVAEKLRWAMPSRAGRGVAGMEIHGCGSQGTTKAGKHGSSGSGVII